MIRTDKLTRREFVKRTAVAGAGAAILTEFALPSALAINNSPPTVVTKWAQALRGLNYPAGHILGALGYPNDPNGIPVAQGIADPVFPNTTLYQLGVHEFTDILHPALTTKLPNGTTKGTTLWGYVDLTNPIPRHLGGLIVTLRNQAVRIRFTNSLPTRHILPLDVTIPGANEAQNRIATHLHGGFIPWISDGGPFDWFSPGCPDYTQGLSFLNGPGGVLDNIPGSPMAKGQADYFYPNNQSTRIMWFHDHAFGLTRLNAYSGLATGYLCVDLLNDQVRFFTNPNGTTNVPAYKDMVPLVWQEKSFVWGNPANPGNINVVPPIPATPATGTFLTDPTWADVTRPDVRTQGSLWYEHTYNPMLYTLKAGLPVPEPSIIPEFFGDTMLCNGSVYPVLTVDPKAYRFMMLNATNSRFLNINTFVANATADKITLNAKTLFPINAPGPAITQIGTEAGYLATDVKFTTSAATAFNPATLSGNLILGPAERADAVIDFSAFAGKDIIVYNDAPAPFPGGAPTNDYFIGNPKNPVVPVAGAGPDTRQILLIRVRNVAAAPANNGPFLAPSTTALDPAPLAPIVLPAAPVTGASVVAPLVPPAGTTIRPLTLNEAFDKWGRLLQLLGTTTPQPGGGYGQPYLNAPTEVVKAGATEIWRIYNTSADTHPVHFHLVNVQVLQRQPFKITSGTFVPAGPARGPQANELGWKDTVQMHPGEATDVMMKFDLPATPFAVPPSPRTGGNEYVWHCHILEHEEHDMMRPLVVN